MRKPEPWYWAARKGWYVQLDKRQIRLGPDENPQPKARPRPPLAIMREYYRVMGANGKLEATDRSQATVAEVCEMFLESKSQLRCGSLSLYTHFAKKLAAPFLGRPFRTLRKEDLLRVAESHVSWGPASKHKFLNVAFNIFGWARDAGYLDFNPLAGWTNPYHAPKRERGLTEAEFTALMDHSPDVEFKQIMLFLRGTACRASEAGVIEAKHVHPERPLVILPATMHKTGGRTGKDRVLVMPADVEVMIRALAARYPSGPLLRNWKTGKGWTRWTIWGRFNRYREKLGLAKDVTPHMIRHASLTRLLDQGTPTHLAAKIAGHSGLSTIQSTYYHPDVDLMVDAANRAHERKKG